MKFHDLLIARFYLRRLHLLLALLALAGCGRQGSAPPAGDTVAPPTIAPPSSVALFTPPASATSTIETPRPTAVSATASSTQAVAPAPTTAPMQPDPSTPFPPPSEATVRLAREPDGWRLEPATGRFSAVGWSEGWPAQLEAQWVPAAGAQQSFFSHLVEPDQGTLNLAHGGGFQIVASEEITQPLSVRLFDVRTGEWQTIFSLDPAVPQWATTADRSWEFASTQGTIAARWVGEHAFVLSLIPFNPEGYDQILTGWGKLLLVDTSIRQARVLAEQGQLAEVFPDGSLLIRHGWVDGPVQLLAPPYDQPPTTLAPGGPWSSDWVISPDRKRVAWLEWTPPATGDWSQRLPHRCCSGDPPPQIAALVIWDQTSQQLKRFTVEGIRWWPPADLRWRYDSDAIYLSTHIDQPQVDRIKQIELGMDGQRNLLISGEYGYTIQLVALGSDGSRYAYLSGHPGQNSVELFHQSPNGQIAVLRRIEPTPGQRTFRRNPFLAWRVTERGRIVERYDDGTVVVLDVVSGRELARFVVSPLAEVSPDGHWIASIDGPTVHIRALP